MWHNRGATYNVEIRRTAGGIPHIKARDFASLGYGTAYAMAQDNVCLMADQYLTFAAERSKFLGPDNGNLESDFFYKLFIDRGDAEEPLPSKEQAALFRGAAAGYNRYLRDTGIDNLPDASCRGEAWVREITETDVRRITHMNFFLPFFRGMILAANPPAIPVASSSSNARKLAKLTAIDIPLPKGKGSNGIALGGEATENGRGMLLANPHQPWFGTARFYAMHQTIPGVLDVLGANQINRPQVGFGTTKNVAWTSTVSTARRFSFYMLYLTSPTSYIFDGVPHEMKAETVTVQVLQPDGSLAGRSHTFYSTHFGAFLVGGQFPWAPTFAFAARFTDSGWRGTDALLSLYQARSVRELKAVHDRYQFLPVNLIAADAEGETLYADDGPIPNLTDEQLASCSVFFGAALNGSTSACQWGTDPDAAVPGIFGPGNLPHLFRNDYVTNSNGSYWLTNPAEPLTGFNQILGDTSTERTLRTRAALLMVQRRLDGSDGLGEENKFGLEQLQTLALHDDNYSSELLRDGLVTLCEANPVVTLPDSSTVDIQNACPILATWDRRSDLDSRGAHLFREFLRLGNGSRWLPKSLNYTTPFDPADPVNTPAGLDATNNPEALVWLAQAVKLLRDAGIPLDAKLGDVQYVVRNGERIPIHGGEEFEGVINKISSAFQGSAGYPEVTGSSSSWIQATAFTEDGPKSRGILTYSLSTNPDSPHYADQTKLFSKKEWVDLPFRWTDVVKATISKIHLVEGKGNCRRGGLEALP